MSGGPNGGPPRFTLEAPLDTPYIATARMFAASVARQYELPEETIEDLKLAISEACARAIDAGPETGRLSLSAERRGERIVFEIAQGAPDAAAPERDALEAGLHLELIAALFGDAEAAPGAGGNVIRFSAG